jgi:hypothetical protein
MPMEMIFGSGIRENFSEENQNSKYFALLRNNVLAEILFLHPNKLILK